MKKAKIILIAIIFWGLMGGTLAYETNRSVVAYCRLGSPGPCTLTYYGNSFTNTMSGTLYCTLLPAVLCTIKVEPFMNP